MRLKNCKLFGKRGLSVLLSLVLCLSMASPAFAASFSQLQDAINKSESVYQEGKDAESKEEGAEKYKIEVTEDKTVKLWENVTYGGTTDAAGITIQKGQNITLDLNSHNINGGYDAAKGEGGSGQSIITNNGTLTLEDKTAETVQKSNEDGTATETYVSGKITGANANSGGAVYNNPTGVFTMKSGAIEGNKAANNGGGIINNGTANIEGGVIKNNEAKNGGGIFNIKDLTIKNAAIQDNTADNGGGIYHQGTSLTMKNSTVEGNISTNGGGIYNAGTNRIEIVGSTIKGNNASLNGGNGGGIHNKSDAGIKMTNATIEGNKAFRGGGIYNGQGVVEMDGGSIKGNTVTYNAAAVFNGGQFNSSNVAITENKFIPDQKNERSEKSSIVSNYGGTVTMKNTTFAENLGVGDQWCSIKNVNTNTGTFTVDAGTKLEHANGGYILFNAETTVKLGTWRMNTAEMSLKDGWVASKQLNSFGEYVVSVWDSSEESVKGSFAFTLAEGYGMDDIVIDEETGNISIPASSILANEAETGKLVTYYPSAVTVLPDGTIESELLVTTGGNGSDNSLSVNSDGVVTSSGAVEYVYGSKSGSITPPAGSGIEIASNGTITVPASSTVDGEVSLCGGYVGPDGVFHVIHTEETIPAVPATETESGWSEGVRCSVCGEVLRAPVEVPTTGPATPEQPETPETPDVPAPGGDDDFGDDGAGTATIAEQDVPLAGIVLVKDVLAELYKHEGSPDGEDAEGEYVKAIAWAIANGIVAEDADVDAVVTVAVLKEMLTNYAASVGGVLTVSIDGEDDDVVMNCGEILAKVFETL